MVQYSIQIVNKIDSKLITISHSIDLPNHLENHPEQLFDLEFKEKLRSLLQQKTSCVINNVKLEKIVSTWIKEIREGYRSTRIEMELTPLELENIHRLEDPGDIEIPELLPPDFSQIYPQGGALPPLNFN